MIRVFNQKSGGGAKKYFRDALAREDYYTEGHQIIGLWHGKASELLGVDGEIKKEEFERLCDNKHPTTGAQLTPRNDANRIVGFDFNLHAPKSLSLVQSITGDERLVEAFRRSVSETMAEMEKQTATRIRLNDANEDLRTGNLAWAEFVHFTARPVDGEPDPHLHVHAFVFNATFNSVEGRWKAAKIRDARRDIPMHQAAFHARLAKRVSDLGYAVKRTRSGWEIIGIERDTIEKFSRRTAVIEEAAKQRGITADIDKDGLGALTREGKRKGQSHDELRAIWDKRLTASEREEIHDLAYSRIGKTITPREAVDHAIEKQFARDAVVRKTRVLAEGMRYGVGTVTPDQIRDELASRRLIEKEIDGQTLITTYDVLAEEVALVATVREGKGRYKALAPKSYQISREYLSDEQKAAVRHILHSNDRVIAVRGGAGTGKTTAMQEAVEAIQLHGHEVYAFAPSADASRDTLRKAGFKNAETVAHYLQSEKLQKQSRGHVIWIDEAGLLGTRDMWRLVEATGPNTKILLTGDTNQHGPVARGKPFHVMQEYGGLKPAEITEIRRQEPEIYKSAVDALSKGNLKAGFGKLEEMGAIAEIKDEKERYRVLAKDYLELSTPKRRPLVVSPTHHEGRKATEAIRSTLLEAKKLEGKEREITRYESLNLEATERKEAENYREGLMIQYHQNAKGIRRGERLTVSRIGEDGGVFVRNEQQKENKLQLENAERFQVFEAKQIGLNKGDLIRISRNGKSLDGKRHSNGNIRQIEGLTKKGDIKLTTGAVISKEDGHFKYGYCMTSHSAQSKSVRDVLIAQSADSLVASSREQFYVSVSRGKQLIRVYTDNREALQEAVGNSAARPSGLELANFSPAELNEFMQRELNSSQWRKAVEQRRGKDEAKSHVQQLLKERKGQGAQKAKGASWTQYVTQR
ncbi:MAG: MobF family relaxase, partial [Verrucomicrobiota bacterium]